jgi:hypothetical protein
VQLRLVSRDTGVPLPTCTITDSPSVFASRITTTQPWFNKTIRRLEWDRFAAKLSGPSSLTPDPERGIVHIPWPDKKIAPKPSRDSPPTSFVPFLRALRLHIMAFHLDLDLGLDPDFG